MSLTSEDNSPALSCRITNTHDFKIHISSNSCATKLISKGINENDCVAFKCANHQSKGIPETMMHTHLANIQ